MGTYLTKPNTAKDTQTGSSTKIKYASTSMQGWRVYQEDAHNCILNLVDGWSLFSVYDGHGGPEVAQYTAEKLPDFLKDLFKEGEPVEQNFQDVFIEYDDHLRGAEAMKKLKQIAGVTKDNQTNDNEEEVVKMFEESSLPVKELLEKYGVRLLRRNSGGMAQSLEDGVEPEDLEDEEELPDDEEKEEDNEHENGEEKEPIKTKKRSSTEKEENECKRRKVEEEEGKEKEEETSEQVNADDEKSNEEVDESHAEGGSNGACGTIGEEDEDSDDPSWKEEDEESDELVDESGEEIDEDDEEREVMEAANIGGEVPGEDSGTTACVCLLSDSKIIVANIGDSRAVLCRDGKAIDLSVDHKPEDEAETRRIEKAGGKVTEDGRVNGGLNLSRAFGDHFYKKNTDLPLAEQMISALPDVITKELSPEDRFLIVACDGIWNSMESQQVVDYVKERLEKKRSLDDIVEELCDSCMADNTAGDGTGCDNMTVILIDLQKTQDESQTTIL